MNSKILKRMIFASMVIACVANTAQATQGPARQKYENFHKRLGKTHSFITGMVRGGTAAFIAGGTSAAAGAIVGNKDAISVGAFLAVAGYLSVGLGLNLDIVTEEYDSYLWDKAEAEEKKATQAC